MNPIQGKYAVLSFLKDTFLPYVCGTNVTLNISTPSVPSRTRESGAWKTSIYQSIGYTISLAGVLVFDAANFDGLEIVRNQMQLMYLPFRIAYTAADGTIKSFQGLCKIVDSATDGSVGDVCKGTYTLEGSGPLMQFDGLIPCPSAIVTIVPTGTTDPSGNVSISYTYTGSVAQIKYRVNGQGDYIFATVDTAILLNGLTIGTYSIEIIPICPNGYEGTGLIQDFQVTRGGSCSSAITNITISGDNKASNTHTGPAPNMQYRIDGGAWIGPVLINTVVNLASLSVGPHSIEEVPICTSGVTGTGFINNFTITSNPNQSNIGYDFGFIAGPGLIAMRIYVHGFLTVSQTNTSSGTITAPVGILVKFEMQVAAGYLGNMITEDVTTSTTLDTRGGTSSSVVTYSYTFTANGDDFSLTGTIDNP